MLMEYQSYINLISKKYPKYHVTQKRTFCNGIYHTANHNQSFNSEHDCTGIQEWWASLKLYNAHIRSGTYSSFVTSLSIRRSDRTCMLWTWNKPERSKASCGYELSAEQIPEGKNKISTGVARGTRAYLRARAWRSLVLMIMKIHRYVSGFLGYGTDNDCLWISMDGFDWCYHDRRETLKAFAVAWAWYGTRFSRSRLWSGLWLRL